MPHSYPGEAELDAKLEKMGFVDCDFPAAALKKELDHLAPGLDMGAVEAYWRSRGFSEEEMAYMRWAPVWISMSWKAYKYDEFDKARGVLAAHGYEFADESAPRRKRPAWLRKMWAGICPGCGGEVVAKRSTKVFCSAACRQRVHREQVLIARREAEYSTNGK